MKPLALLQRHHCHCHRPLFSLSRLPNFDAQTSKVLHVRSFRGPPSSLRCHAREDENASSSSGYQSSLLDDIFLRLFRNKMAQEVGWDSDKPGYDGLIDVANRLMLSSKSNSDAIEAAVRILRSLFPPFLLELYKMLIAPVGGGKVAAMMVARVTALTCQWLMGPCKVNSVELPDGTLWDSGVFVERCRYLEESKCIGICANTCKLPTEDFFKIYMGVPLLMEPNFTDFSCQFKFGVLPPPLYGDRTLKEPCLEICPNAIRHRESNSGIDVPPCPKALN